MEKAPDSYQTIDKAGREILFKARKSKFYGHAFPIKGESDVKPIIDGLRKRYAAANHVCYAWQIGTGNPLYRANDDGEPNNSAGMPIYGQIKAFGVTDVLVAVVRVFGGTKLGVGGLIQAYRSTAQMALEEATFVTKTINIEFEVNFPYSEMDKVMRLIRKNRLNIVSQQMELECALQIAVRQIEADTIADLFKELHKVTLTRYG